MAGALGLTRDCIRIKMRAAPMSDGAPCPSRRSRRFERARHENGKKKNKHRDEINEMEMKRIQRTVEYTSKSGHKGESARGASFPFVWIAAANGMQDKTAGLLSAIHHVPISHDTTDAHTGIQILDLS